MKRIFFVFLVIFQLNVFAGDLYLVCENDDGSEFVSATITNKTAKLELHDGNLDFEVILKIKNRYNIFIVKNTTLGQATTHFVPKNADEIQATENFSCRISD